MRSIKVAQEFKDLFVVGLLAYLVDVLVDDLALLIDDEKRAFRKALGTISAELSSYFPLGFEIRKEIECESPKAPGPGGVAGNRVNRDTQDLGFVALEAAELSLIRRQLQCSNRGPGKRLECDEYVLSPAKVRELNFLAFRGVRVELEIRSYVAHFNSHRFSSI